MEYLNLPFEIKSDHLEEDENFFFFKGFASTYGNIDLVDDRIERGAFKESLLVRRPKVFFEHRETIGVSIEEIEMDKGLFVKAKLPKADTLVSGRVIPQMKIGSINTLSIGFRIRDHRFEDHIRVIEKADLFEYSPVTFAANPEAVITGMKAVGGSTRLPLADRDRPWSGSEARASIKEHTGSTEKPSASYKKYFMWYDAENADKFGSYKLPFAMWIDGQFKAVPKALSAIRGALAGARGGLDGVSADDRATITRRVNAYLNRLGDADKSMILLSDVEHVKNKAEFNTFLKSFGGMFSNESREYLASLINPNQSKSGDGLSLSNSGNGLDTDIREFIKKINI